MNFHEFCVFQKPASMEAELQKAFSEHSKVITQSQTQWCAHFELPGSYLPKTTTLKAKVTT